MTAISVTSVNVLDNPSKVTNPLQFEIQYECMFDLADGERRRPPRDSVAIEPNRPPCPSATMPSAHPALVWHQALRLALPQPCAARRLCRGMCRVHPAPSSPIQTCPRSPPSPARPGVEADVRGQRRQREVRPGAGHGVCGARGARPVPLCLPGAPARRTCRGRLSTGSGGGSAARAVKAHGAWG